MRAKYQIRTQGKNLCASIMIDQENQNTKYDKKSHDVCVVFLFWCDPKIRDEKFPFCDETLVL